MNGFRRKVVAVAVSGGVDSSVAALLMKRRGFRVVGVHMTNWSQADESGETKCERTLDEEYMVFEREYDSLVLSQDYQFYHSSISRKLTNVQVHTRIVIDTRTVITTRTVINTRTPTLKHRYARETCEYLEIPYHHVNFEQEYWNNVFTPLVDGYKLGVTPNPDVWCNREVKFKPLLEYEDTQRT